MEYQDHRQVVAVSVERALIELTFNVWSKVEEFLMSEFNAKFVDCYEHPEYLKSVLQKHYPHFYDQIIHSIKGYMAEFVIDEKLDEFLGKLQD